MKTSEKIARCGLSPMRKYRPLQLKAEERGMNIYHLNIGQPDVQTPDELFDAIKNYCDERPVLSYAPSPGLPALIEAIQKYYKKLGCDYSKDEIYISEGGSEALQTTMLAILDPGDEVIIPEPFYPNYNTFISIAGGVIHPLQTSPEENYFFADKARLEACLTDKTKAILFSNPGNPTGTILRKEDYQTVLEFAKEHDLYVIADEVYREFLYTGEMLTAGQFEGFDDNVIIIDSVSKRFSACGARIGAIISKNKNFMTEMLKLMQGRLAAPWIDQVGAAALYNVSDDYYAAVREEYKKRRDICYNALKDVPGIVVHCPDGAFYMMAKLPVDSADKFQIFLLEEFNDNGDTVMFAAGDGFYRTAGGGVNEIRIAYILKPEKLERAMELLVKGIEAYNAKNK